MIPFKRIFSGRCALGSVVIACIAATLAPVATAGTETVFPNRNRMLKAERPPQCKDWIAPVPDRRTDVSFPEDVRGFKGDAALLLRIGASGEFLGQGLDIYARSLQW
jgi:hypothetical protein